MPMEIRMTWSRALEGLQTDGKGQGRRLASEFPCTVVGVVAAVVVLLLLVLVRVRVRVVVVHTAESNEVGPL